MGLETIFRLLLPSLSAPSGSPSQKASRTATNTATPPTDPRALAVTHQTFQIGKVTIGLFRKYKI